PLYPFSGRQSQPSRGRQGCDSQRGDGQKPVRLGHHQAETCQPSKPEDKCARCRLVSERALCRNWWRRSENTLVRREVCQAHSYLQPRRQYPRAGLWSQWTLLSLMQRRWITPSVDNAEGNREVMSIA